MADKIWDFVGSRWWKFDFHSHTPASEDYGRVDISLKDRKPEEWLLDFMKAEIDCVAITDHNSGEWVDILKKAYDELKNNPPPEFRELVLFPGVEITIEGGVHVLAVFNPDAKTSSISALLGACGIKDKFGTNEICSTKSLTDVISIISKAGAIPIPAHVDEPKGLFKQIFDGQTLKSTCDHDDLFCCEVINSEYSFPELYKSNKNNWSQVVGSDTHKPEEVGRRYTWVKMGKPTIEGLKLALLDGDNFSLKRYDKLHEVPNIYSETLIKNIKIEKAQYCGNGNPLLIELNPWLNCIIGGRGSGKSTIIEFIRIAMRREKEIEELKDSEIRDTFKNFFRKPEKKGDNGALREDTKITIEYITERINDNILNWSWQKDELVPPIQEKSKDGNLTPGFGEIKNIFPIKIYSQKQIYALASRPEALLKIIDDSPEVGYREWKSDYDLLCAQYRSLRSRIRELLLQINEKDSIKGELTSVKRKLEIFQQGENANLLKEYQSKIAQEKEVLAFIQSIEDNSTNLQKIEIDTIVPKVDLFSGSDGDIFVRELIENNIQKIKEVNIEFEKIKDNIKSISEHFSEEIKKSEWKKIFLEIEIKYNNLIAKLKGEGVSNPEEYTYLVQKKQMLGSKEKNIDNLLDTIKNLEKASDELSKKIFCHRLIISERREKFILEIIKNNSFVKIEIRKFGDKNNLENSFRELFGFEEEIFKNDILSFDEKKGLLSPLYEIISEQDDILSIKNELESLKKKLRDIHEKKQTYDPNDQRFSNRIVKLPDELLDSFDLWFPEDGISVSYKRENKKEEFVPIEQGSAGQKTAAILAFLLSYGSEPIIIDQPEDDLDNHLIYNLVVNQIKEIKKRRQIIIVTHNPNIVVNGDAEMVYALGFKDGQTNIIEKGCLQEKGIRKEICQVMEGGTIAFKQRYRRINLED